MGQIFVAMRRTAMAGNGAIGKNSEGLAQGPYVVARAGFELTTLRTIDVESTSFRVCSQLEPNHKIILDQDVNRYTPSF